MLPGAHLQVEDRALLRMDRDCRIIVHGDARVSAKAKTLRKLRKKGQVVTLPQ